MDFKTAKAFNELRIAAAKHMGWDPDKVTMTICRPNPIEATEPDDIAPGADISSRPPVDEFFYQQHSF